MIRISLSIALGLLFFVINVDTSASAPTPATPDKMSIIVEKAEISSDDLAYITIFDDQANPVDVMDLTTSPIQKDQIPVGIYRVLRLTVKNISWQATWIPANPSPCDGATDGTTAAGSVDLGGQTDFYFKTPDLGGNTLAYYRANPPLSLSAYVGDANHPFVLAAPIQVVKDGTTTVNLVIGAAKTLTCDGVKTFDRTTNTPIGTLSGPATRLTSAEGIYFDPYNQEIGVNNSGNNSVTVYDWRTSGDTSPKRILIGPDTRLNGPAGIVLYTDPLDPTQGEIIVANQGNDSVTVYSRPAAGNAKPLRTIVGVQTGLSRPAGIALYLDPGGNPVKDELFVANQGNDSLTVYNRLFSENTAPLRTISGPQNTGLSSPCGLYVDTKNDEIGVANSGNGTVTIYNRMDDGDVPPKHIITGLSSPCGLYVDTDNDEIGVADNDTVKVYKRQSSGDYQLDRTITGLNDPHALYLDASRTPNEIGVVLQGPQAVMAFAPAIFPSSADEAASNSILSGDYNVTLYGVDIKGMSGHGILVPVVLAERGKANFDPKTTPWPSFSLSLDTQLRRQVLELDCPQEPDFGNTRIGFYGVNDDGSFYAFLPNNQGSLRGAFLPDGSIFVGSMIDSSNELRLVYGVRRPVSTVAPYLTSDGTSTGGVASYAFTSYRNDLFVIKRFNSPPGNDLFEYLLAIGMVHTAGTNFTDVSDNTTNSVAMLNPTGDFASPLSGGPIYNLGTSSSPTTKFAYDIGGGGLLESSLDGLAGAVDADGATLIFMRNTVTKDDNGCPTDIGFGMGLRQSPPGTFHTGSLKGTYFVAGFGDRFNIGTQTSSHRSTAAAITFDGVGNAEVKFIENEMGTISADQAAFTYRVNSISDVVDIFYRNSGPYASPYASALIGNNGRTLAFFRNLNPDGQPNPTRLLGLALFQHP